MLISKTAAELREPANETAETVSRYWFKSGEAISRELDEIQLERTVSRLSRHQFLKIRHIIGGFGDLKG